jgi:redox-sensitive bicupin YhaK (pirin superfamily)
MMKPRYQDLTAQHIPHVISPDEKVEAKIIAGEFLGTSSHIETRVPITYLHLKIKPGGQVEQPIPQTHNSFVYILKGTGNFGEEQKPADEGKIILFKQDGDFINIQNPENQTETLELLLLAGQPLNETVVRYGPFVMNTEEEIYQTITDFRSGRFGEISR